jgi:hypothetical protein
MRLPACIILLCFSTYGSIAQSDGDSEIKQKERPFEFGYSHYTLSYAPADIMAFDNSLSIRTGYAHGNALFFRYFVSSNQGFQLDFGIHSLPFRYTMRSIVQLQGGPTTIEDSKEYILAYIPSLTILAWTQFHLRVGWVELAGGLRMLHIRSFSYVEPAKTPEGNGGAHLIDPRYYDLHIENNDESTSQRLYPSAKLSLSYNYMVHENIPMALQVGYVFQREDMVHGNYKFYLSESLPGSFNLKASHVFAGITVAYRGKFRPRS